MADTVCPNDFTGFTAAACIFPPIVLVIPNQILQYDKDPIFYAEMFERV
jgi:hypothetical protein